MDSHLSSPFSPNPNPNYRRHHRLPLINGETYHVKGHCNGLLCLIGGPIILYNPSLSRYRTLPSPSNFNGKGEVIGIGYDSSVDDYKIVRVPSSKYKFKGYKPQIEVLSLNLNSNSWRKLPEIETPPYFMIHDSQSLYVNGGIYWYTVGEVGPTLIVRFDVSKERFSEVPHPPGHGISWMGVINRSFCAVFSHSESYFDIWETQDNLNWKKLITVSKFGNPRPYSGYLDHYPLSFIQTGELLIIYPDIGLMAYDPKEHRYRRFALLTDVRGSQVTVYTDSLVFPPEPLDQTGSSFDQAGSSLGQTGSSSSAFTKMFMQLSDAFRSRFSCLSNSAKGCK
jgi:F-box interacting protein